MLCAKIGIKRCICLFLVFLIVTGCQFANAPFPTRLKEDFKIGYYEEEGNEVSVSLWNMKDRDPITREYFAFTYVGDNLTRFGYGKNEKNYVFEDGIEDVSHANTKGMDLICWMQFKDGKEIENNCDNVDDNRLKLMRSFILNNFMDSNESYKEVCEYVLETINQFDYVE